MLISQQGINSFSVDSHNLMRWTGMSAGFVFVAGALPVGFYFDKKRSIAVGLVGSGSGFGAAVVPQATQYFMNQFNWRNTYLFHSGKTKLL